MSASWKSLSNVQVKAGDRGEVSAVFATFDAVDHDGDVTLPGAFTEGQEVVISSYQHKSWDGQLPVGKGRIRTTKSEAILDGQFFMDTVAGRETFSVVRALAESGLGEWSYGFETLDSEPGKFGGKPVQLLKQLQVFEVSPVLRGAGIGTRTLAVKATGLLAPQEMAAREFARFVKADLAREIAAELCEIRDAIEMRAELGAIANKLRSVR